MDIDVDNGLLGILAAGDLIEQRAWPALRSDIVARLDKIARNDFPIPNLPPTSRQRLSDIRPVSPPLSASSDQPAPDMGGGGGSPSNYNNDNDNDNENKIPSEPAEPELPRQIDDMLVSIKHKIESFDPYPPHTIQRLAELVVSPTAHYKALASWLHAVDRTVQVTSGTNAYPLPPPIPDMASMRINGEPTDPSERDHPAAQISWANPPTSTPAAAAVGSDEALGGALLTPIPWLTRRSPEAAAAAAGAPSAHGAQIHSEGTQTIDGPNGMGSIETVSVSVNGVPSMGHARGVTQGELLRQEQRAGVVPVSQLARQHARAVDQATRMDEDREDEERGAAAGGEEEEEVPHARGPQEIGVGDTGPQTASTSFVGESGGIEMQGIDVEAAVGRRRAADDEDQGLSGGSGGSGASREGGRESSPGAESTTSKREAEDDLGELAFKKVKEDTTMEEEEEEGVVVEGDVAMVEQQQQQQEEEEAAQAAETDAKLEEVSVSEDKMET